MVIQYFWSASSTKGTWEWAQEHISRGALCFCSSKLLVLLRRTSLPLLGLASVYHLKASLCKRWPIGMWILKMWDLKGTLEIIHSTSPPCPCHISPPETQAVGPKGVVRWWHMSYWNRKLRILKSFHQLYCLSIFEKQNQFEDIAQFIYQVINGSINLWDRVFASPFLGVILFILNRLFSKLLWSGGRERQMSISRKHLLWEQTEKTRECEKFSFRREAQWAWWPWCSCYSCYGNRKVKWWLLRDTELKQSPLLTGHSTLKLRNPPQAGMSQQNKFLKMELKSGYI